MNVTIGVDLDVNLPESDLVDIVDGKAFINSVMKRISEKSAGIKSDIIIKAMIKTIQSSPNNYVLGQLINEILTKFNNQDCHLQ